MRQDPSLESAAAYKPCTTVTANEGTPLQLIGEFKPVDDLVIVLANFGALRRSRRPGQPDPRLPDPVRHPRA